MTITKCTEEEFLTAMDDFGSWNTDCLALDPNPVDWNGYSDAFHLYVEINPWQHYRVTFRPSCEKWTVAVDGCQELAMNEDPETFRAYN